MLTSGATQLGSRLFDIAMTWLLSIVVLRYLAPSGFGDYSLIVGVVGLTGVFAEFGLPQVATREIARDPAVEPGVVGSMVMIRVTLAVIAIAVVQLLLLPFSPHPSLRLAALVASSVFFVDALLSIVVIFQVRLVQHLEATARLIGSVVRVVLTLMAVRSDSGLLGLFGAQLLALCTVAAVSFYLVRTRIGAKVTFRVDTAKTVARAARAVGPASLVGVLYLKLDVLMVGLLEDRASVGIYGAAYQPIEYLLLLTAVAVQVLLPLIASVALTDQKAFLDRYRLGCDLLIITYGIIAVGIVALAPDAVQVLYDTPFAGAVTPMILLSLALGFMAINAWQGVILLSVGQQRRNLLYLSGASVVNVAVDILLIKWLGLVGAAWGTLITAAALAVASSAGVQRHVGLTFDRHSTGWFVGASAIGCLVAAATRTLTGSGLASAVLGVSVWVAVAWSGRARLRTRVQDLAVARMPVPTTRVVEQ